MKKLLLLNFIIFNSFIFAADENCPSNFNESLALSSTARKLTITHKNERAVLEDVTNIPCFPDNEVALARGIHQFLTKGTADNIRHKTEYNGELIHDEKIFLERLNRSNTGQKCRPYLAPENALRNQPIREIIFCEQKNKNYERNITEKKQIVHNALKNWPKNINLTKIFENYRFTEFLLEKKLANHYDDDTYFRVADAIKNEELAYIEENIYIWVREFKSKLLSDIDSFSNADIASLHELRAIEAELYEYSPGSMPKAQR